MLRLRSLAALALLTASPTLAQQVITLDFDDLVGTAPIPAGYGGVVDWGGWIHTDAPDPNLPATSGATRIRSDTPPQRVSFGRGVTVRSMRLVTGAPCRVRFYRGGQNVVSTQTYGPNIGGPAVTIQLGPLGLNGLIDAFELDTASSNHAVDDLVYVVPPATLGEVFCFPNQTNSTGVSGVLAASGSALVSDNDVTLHATSLPTNAFGFGIVSHTQGLVSTPTGTPLLCINGEIGRLIGPGQIMSSGALGSFDIDVDLAAVPTPTGFVTTVAGDTWNFQVWHRDVGSFGVASSRMTSGVSITFQ